MGVKIDIDFVAPAAQFSIGGYPNALGGQIMGGAWIHDPKIVVSAAVGDTLETTFELGDTVGFEARFVSDTGLAFTPSTTPTITITNPRGTALVSAASMSQSGVGHYTYSYETTTTQLEGVYLIRITADNTDGNAITNTERMLLLKVR